MACRVGITTDLKSRKKYWKGEHPSLRNWQIAGPYKTKSAAQKAEDSFAQQYGCVSHPGGEDKKGTWHVYKFDYDA